MAPIAPSLDKYIKPLKAFHGTINQNNMSAAECLDKKMIAASLGESNPESLHCDRFQIDRTKLRKMMNTASNIQGTNSAKLYFDRIMKTTATYINWPQTYTNDPKCKKNPFVRVYGKQQENVISARKMVLANLQINFSILRLKVVIPNLDQVFIAGKNGKNLNRIMDDSEAFVQFPHSNEMKKGNQVIIHGSLKNLERARVSLRASSPILMSFEVPMNHHISSVKEISDYFRVQVICSVNAKSNTSVVLVKSSARKLNNVKEAIRVLFRSAFGKLAKDKKICLQLEVPPQQHEEIKGENCSRLNQIMDQTNTKISFPRIASRGNKRSQVIISGSIDEVCEARLKLLEHFPVGLTFDIPGENESAAEIMSLGKRSGVYTTISHKERESGMSVTIKSSERCIEKIYEIHGKIMQLLDVASVAENISKADVTTNQILNSVAVESVENEVRRRSLASSLCSEEIVCQDANILPNSGSLETHESDSWTILRTPEFDCGNGGRVSNTQFDSAGKIKEVSQFFDSSRNGTEAMMANDLHQRQQMDSRNVGWITSYVTPVPFLDAHITHPQATLNHTDHHSHIAYIPESHSPQDWKILGFQGIEAIHHMSVQQIKAYVEDNECNDQNSLFVQDPTTADYFEPEFAQNFEPEARSLCSSLGFESPLIVGTEESVAERLICTGWGNAPSFL